MIKINLAGKKKKIEKIFLEDLVGPNNGNQKKGKFVKILDLQESKDILGEKRELYSYFYDIYGELKLDKIEELLLADRNKMIHLIENFGYCDKGYSDKLLKKVFRYDNFSKRKVVYDILDEIGITVCPYCNRSYIMTIKKGKVRPQLDHYFPKSKYPFLALSLYNLIPSCSNCNMAKSNLDTLKNPILYPYEEEFGETVKFTVGIENYDEFVKYLEGVSNKIKLDIYVPEQDLADKVNNQNSGLHITDLYNEHKDYIMDIFKSYHINTDRRIRELSERFPEIFSSEDEIKNLLFMTYFNKEDWGKRPLAKLTHDIYNELEKLKNGC